LQFQQELQRRKIEWFPSLELNSLDLVHHYVAEGFGVGLVPVLHDRALPKGTRLVPLEGFPDLPYAALWMGKLTPLLEAVMEEVQGIAVGLR